MQRMKRVLILEDNTVAAYSLEKAVKNMDLNAEVTCVTQYVDACMMVTDRFFDLFIVDIILDKSYVLKCLRMTNCIVISTWKSLMP